MKKQYIFLTVFIVLSIFVFAGAIFINWVGCLCFVFGFICLIYAVICKSSNLVMKEINQRMLEQLTEVGKLVGETSLRLQIISDYINKVHDNIENEEKANSNTDKVSE